MKGCIKWTLIGCSEKGFNLNDSLHFRQNFGLQRSQSHRLSPRGNLLALQLSRVVKPAAAGRLEVANCVSFSKEASYSFYMAPLVPDVSSYRGAKITKLLHFSHLIGAAAF